MHVFSVLAPLCTETTTIEPTTLFTTDHDPTTEVVTTPIPQPGNTCTAAEILYCTNSYAVGHVHAKGMT